VKAAVEDAEKVMGWLLGNHVEASSFEEQLLQNI
jgi:hypothetical protein